MWRAGWLVIGRTAFTVLLRTCWAPDLLGAHELLAAARCRSLQIRRLAFKMIQFEATISDQVGHRRRFEIPLHVHPDDFKKLCNPSMQQDAIRGCVQMCLPQMMAAERWVCSAGEECTEPATTMLNTPGFWPAKDGLPPTIREMMGVPICSNPACLAEARRQTEKALRAVSKQSRKEGISDTFRSGQHYSCKSCGKMSARDAGALKKCARCRAVWYCNAECQKSHWKVHKKVCSPPPES